jgi:hypothetical protein
MSATYVALPFLRTEDGIATGQAQEMPSASAAVRRAELMSQVQDRDKAMRESDASSQGAQ